MVTLTHLFKPEPDEGKAWCAELHPMGTTHPLSSTCLRCLAIAMQHYERIVALSKPHDEGSAPPKGFVRMRIELDVPEDIDPSDVLERAHGFAGELLEAAEVGEINGGEDDEDETHTALVDRIENRVSVQQMEG